jgi:rare lipoprotein A
VKPGDVERGIASWYGHPYHGRTTASGETYDMHRLTAAHRTLAFDTVVRVTRRDTGASVEVRINDRGPFIEGRIIDLSYAAAQHIGLDVDGVAPVEVKILKGRRTEDLEPPPTASPEPPPPAAECWWVQVGAFGDRSNADRAESRLEDAGEKAIVMESEDGLLRVRVGPIDSRDEADATRDRVLPDWPKAAVVGCG